MGITVDISKQLGNFSLEISFESDAGRIGILGPSGCGKSMTLRSIAGIDRPDRGRIVNGSKFLFDSEANIDVRPQMRKVGYMFQNYALFPSMTVGQNIGAGLRVEKEEKEARVSEMIRRFSLGGLEGLYPSQLSGGQQQRVALARIMAYRPELILLDEPFSALDQNLRERLQHEMAELLSDYDGQIIMVSHSRDEIYRFADELLVMDEGRILAQGRTKEMFGDPGTVAVAKMTGCKNFSAAVRKDAHHLQLTDWGIDLHLEREVPEDIDAVGYRAHHFVPVWDGGQENCLPCSIVGVDELPFERRYYIEAQGADAKAEKICWFVQESERKAIDQKGVPGLLRMEEDQILLLRSGQRK